MINQAITGSNRVHDQFGSFADRLQNKIDQMKNPTVIGLDPMLHYIPSDLLDLFRQQCDDPAMATGLAIAEFNRRLIDAVCDIVPAVKPQLACYEQYGIHGLEALRQTVLYAQKKGMLVIADGKRNDIGSTAEAYARAFLGTARMIDDTEQAFLAADCITLNGYLGTDGIEPFLELCRSQNKGVFILVRTSNASAGDFQDLALADGRLVYEAMADQVNEWGQQLIGQCGYSSAGAVVGATWPRQAVELRKRMPHTFMLIPGYGAQGAAAAEAVAGFGEDGKGGIVNASRSLMLAWKKHDMEQDLFDLACRKEALRMRTELTQALEEK